MLWRPCYFSIAVLMLSGCGSDDTPTPPSSPQTTKIDRSNLTNLGTGPLDYANPNLWLCLPGNDPNECRGNLDATRFNADGTSTVVKHVRAESPAFDCFYVYPTVDLSSPSNTDSFADIKNMLDPLLNQAARFTSICEVYAPLYRQQAISLASSALVGDAELAFSDVEAAFDQYLRHWNNGRKFVLIGHSQGTFMLERLITERFETDPALRGQLISALLLGGFPSVPQGEVVGGSFQNFPACTRAGETGCVIGYNAFAAEAPPTETAVFGRGAAGQETLCTTPGPLANNAGRSRGTYFPKILNVPTFRPDTPAGELPPFDTPYAVLPDILRGECVRETVGATPFHYLKVTHDPPPADQRTIAPYRSLSTEAVGFGLHVTEYGLFLDDLVEAVKLQSAAALK